MASSSRIRLFLWWTIVGSTRLRCTYRLSGFIVRNPLDRNQNALRTEIECFFEREPLDSLLGPGCA
jgi:hypothetical protein